jgi:Family of unknown function (DUF5681)
MAKRFPLKSSPDKVGYGRPPKATQFKPGNSGNPKGRPKGPKSVGAVLYGILHRRIEVTENGGMHSLIPRRWRYFGMFWTTPGQACPLAKPTLSAPCWPSEF